MKKTLPIRVLEAKGLAFEPLEQSKKEYSAEAVAVDLGVNVAGVLKAMLVRYADPERSSPSGSFALFVTPGNRRLSLKKAAEILGDKNVDLANERDVERITGFQVGAVSVLGLRRKDTPCYVDEGIFNLKQVIISGGRPDLGLRLDPETLIAALEHAELGDFCE